MGILRGGQKMIGKESLRKNIDCFMGFVSMSHIGCNDRGSWGVIVESSDKYVCEKCREEVTKEVWKSMFKKRIATPHKEN